MSTMQSDLEAIVTAHPELASLRTIDGVSDLLVWCLLERVDAAHIDIVAHDEYTHDAILEWHDRFLVFGLTRLGSLTAVAVWSHRPTPAELLQARVFRGWRPTPSALRKVSAVLGNACSLARTGT